MSAYGTLNFFRHSGMGGADVGVEMVVRVKNGSTLDAWEMDDCAMIVTQVLVELRLVQKFSIA